MFITSISGSSRARSVRLAALVVLGLAGAVACGSDESGSTASVPSTSPTTDNATDSAPTAPTSAPTTSVKGGGATGGGAALDAAVADLVTRLDLPDASTIETVTVEEVTWPDRSLGCPQKDMQYAQVLTPGIRIVLAHDGAEYAYHGGNGRLPVYCPRPQPPAPD